MPKGRWREPDLTVGRGPDGGRAGTRGGLAQGRALASQRRLGGVGETSQGGGDALPILAAAPPIQKSQASPHPPACPSSPTGSSVGLGAGTWSQYPRDWGQPLSPLRTVDPPPPGGVRTDEVMQVKG